MSQVLKSLITRIVAHVQVCFVINVCAYIVGWEIVLHMCVHACMRMLDGGVCGWYIGE